MKAKMRTVLVVSTNQIHEEWKREENKEDINIVIYKTMNSMYKDEDFFTHRNVLKNTMCYIKMQLFPFHGEPPPPKKIPIQNNCLKGND